MPAPNPTFYLEDLRARVQALGGVLLSETYVNDITLLRFRCAKGHEFELAPGKLKQGRWCQTCGFSRGYAKRKAPTSARLMEIVQARGGRILSKQYINSITHLCFQCAKGHAWDAVPGSILQGTWCPKCAHENAGPRTLSVRQDVADRISAKAASRGGARIGPYVNFYTPVRFRCEAGHEFELLPQSLHDDQWCPDCWQQGVLRKLQDIAKRYGGECLSTRYAGTLGDAVWRCKMGHQFSSTVQRVLRGSWCPQCRGSLAGSIEQMHRMAAERGGLCLSTEYVSAETKLRWRCAEGHEWEQKPATISQGFWCRVCQRGYGRPRARLSIAIMQEMAEERGGRCLSEEYHGVYDILRWRCARGHEWATAANNVRRGGWCPTCSHVVPGTLGAMQALAVERQGRCLTTSWLNHREPLEFECAAGHRFQLRANVVKSGAWCTTCAPSEIPPVPDRLETSLDLMHRPRRV